MFRGIFGVIVKVIILAGILLILAWISISVYSCINPQSRGQSNTLDMPDQNEAAYSLYIENTGNLILTADYEIHGSEVGNRVFVLHGFWELRGQEFVFKDAELVLDEAIFGEITIKRRTE